MPSLIHDRGLIHVTGEGHLDRVVTFEKSPLRPLSGRSIACCVTAYNEHGYALIATLSALLRNFQYLKSDRDPKFHSVEGVICVVIDGAEKMSQTFQELAVECGLLEMEAIDRLADVNVFSTSLDGAKIHQVLQKIIDLDPPDPWLRSNRALIQDELAKYKVFSEDVKKSSVQVVFYIKTKNAGKLDSHWHFFEVISRAIEPTYCVQVDVSTIPARNALLEMLRSIESGENISGVTIKIYVAKPESSLNVLHSWQCIDMLIERSVLLPMQKVTGYLSVLAGQMCMLKRASLLDPKSGGVGGVLQSYYGGLKESNVFKTNMYLTEDCLLGLEIVFEPNSQWDNNLAPLSEATTDQCDSWRELLAQRRRWILGSFSCKIRFFYKLVQMVSSNFEQAFKRKRTLILASPYLLFLAISQWFTIGLIASFITALCLISRDYMPAAMTSALSPVTRWIPGVMIATVMIQLVFCINRMRARWSAFLVSVCVGLQSIVFLTSLIAIVVFGFFNPSLHYVPIVVLANTAMLAFIVYLHSNRQYNFVNLILPYRVFSAAVNFFLHLYAVCNADDASWGTKGLVRQPMSQKRKELQFKIFRWTVIATAVLTNSMLVYLLFSHGLLNRPEFVLFIGSMEIVSRLFSLGAYFHIVKEYSFLDLLLRRQRQ